MARNILTVLLGSKHDRDLRALVPQAQRINSLEPEVMALADEEFPRRTDGLRRGVKQ